MTNKNRNILKMIVSASMAAISIVSAGTTAIATNVEDEYDIIHISEAMTNNGTTDVTETFDFSGLMSSCSENVKNTYKEQYPNHSELIDSIVDSIISDGEFIEYFENEGPIAFQIVADALNDSLEPKTSLYSFGNESYYSKYNSYPCKQLYSYYDGPAAVVMALMGSGCISYTQNKSLLDSYQRTAAIEMGTNSIDNTLSHKITDYLQKKYVEKFGQNTGRSFKTKVFNRSNADYILDLIQTSLACDAEPIIKIPDRSALCNHRNETGSLYVTVKIADDQGEYIVYTDPSLNNGQEKTLSYDELKALTNLGSVWMSALC